MVWGGFEGSRVEGKELSPAQIESLAWQLLCLMGPNYEVFLPDLYCMSERSIARVKEEHLPEWSLGLFYALECCYC